jgi:hypothetical protein
MSTLSQFYPSGGGGGGGIVTTSGEITTPSIALMGLVGQTPLPIPTNWTAFNKCFLIATTTGSPYTANWVPTSWAEPVDTMVINHTFVNFSPPAGSKLKHIRLNSGGINFTLVNTQSIPDLTDISGAGVFMASAAGGLSALKSIATSLTICPTGTANALMIKGAALDAATVNHLLTNLVANGFTHTPASGSYTIDLSGGTSAGTSQLTAAGLAAKAALVAGGFTVTLNP